MSELEPSAERFSRREPIIFVSEDGDTRQGLYVEKGRIALGESESDGSRRIRAGRSIIFTNDGGITRPFLVNSGHIIDVQKSVVDKKLTYKDITGRFNFMDLTIGQEYRKFDIYLPPVTGVVIDGQEGVYQEGIPEIPDPFVYIEQSLIKLFMADRMARNKFSLDGKLKTGVTHMEELEVSGDYL